MQKKSEPPVGIEPTTFQIQIGRINHWAMGDSHSEQVAGHDQDIISWVHWTKAKQYTNLLASHKHLKKVLCTFQSQPSTHAISLMKLEIEIQNNWEMLGKKPEPPSKWWGFKSSWSQNSTNFFFKFCRWHYVLTCRSSITGSISGYVPGSLVAYMYENQA